MYSRVLLLKIHNVSSFLFSPVYFQVVLIAVMLGMIFKRPAVELETSGSNALQEDEEYLEQPADEMEKISGEKGSL